jgi:hypothetical protein
MTCLTESICNPSDLFELIRAAAAAVDYAGTHVFGSQWQAIGPDVALHTGAIQELLADFFAEPRGGCQRFATLRVING